MVKTGTQGYIEIPEGTQRYPPGGTQRYPGVHRSTRGYTEVNGGYLEVPGCTQRYPGVPRGTRGYPEVPGGTQGYPGVPRGTPGIPRGTPGVPRGAQEYPEVPGVPGGYRGVDGSTRGYLGLPVGTRRYILLFPVHSDDSSFDLIFICIFFYWAQFAVVNVINGYKLDGVGPVDNRLSTHKLYPFVTNKQKM